MKNVSKQDRLRTIFDTLTREEISIIEKKYGATKDEILAGKGSFTQELSPESIQEMTNHYLDKIRKRNSDN